MKHRLLIASTSLLALAACASQPTGTHVDTPLWAGAEKLPQRCSEADIRIDDEGSRDARRAAETLAELCAEEAHARSCFALGEMSLVGCGVPRDEYEAHEYLRRGCDLGEGRACGELGVLAVKSGVTEDSAVTVSSLLLEGCDAGHALACRELGELLYEGEVLPSDRTWAVRLWSKGCSKHDRECCFRAGTALLATDAETGYALLDRACDEGHANACARVRHASTAP